MPAEAESALVEEIYETVVFPERWGTVVEDICGLTKATAGLIFTPAVPVQRGGIGRGSNIDPAAHASYGAYYHAKDILVHEAATKQLDRTGAVLTSEMIVEEKRFRRSEFFNDFLKPAGFGRTCSTILHDGTLNSVPRVNLSLYRPVHADPFGHRNVTMLARLSGHLRRAAKLQFRLRQEVPDVCSATLECLPWGVLLLDASEKVVYLNTFAEAKLRAKDGLSLGGGRLLAARADETRRLRAAITRALGGPLVAGSDVGADLAISRPSGKRPLLMTVAPVSPLAGEVMGSPAARCLVHLVDLEMQSQDAIQRLGDILGLTRAERRLARGLIEGLTLGEIAENHELSRETIRSQLNGLFAKTETRRQSELTALLVRYLVLPSRD